MDFGFRKSPPLFVIIIVIIIIIIIIGELMEKMPKPTSSAVPSMQLSISKEDITNACHFTI